jgi:hypothetical protein
LGIIKYIKWNKLKHNFVKQNNLLNDYAFSIILMTINFFGMKTLLSKNKHIMNNWNLVDLNITNFLFSIVNCESYFHWTPNTNYISEIMMKLIILIINVFDCFLCPSICFDQHHNHLPLINQNMLNLIYNGILVLINFTCYALFLPTKSIYATILFYWSYSEWK